ncbi:UDP-3-O-acylglucosamine N-acyltransferase [Bacteroidia bacterium]|nr:UDP-3-O-acylglucosamine N-acyltransferase [Bacteroidia bacterium]GHT27143.1 UDP-3-O-acylglucosamine N-acyltransferase [Bacteroidia bacterium]GHU82782.1 UDP-3-O-acylglucosamine N-acyltransferase [Bacteroidia bacterium]
MEFSAQQIAGILQGKIEGNAQVSVSNFSKIEEGKPGTLTFLANLKYLHYIYETKASIALVNEDFVPEKKLPETLTLIRVANAYSALAILLNLVDQAKPQKRGVEPMSYISPSANVPLEEVYIGAFAYIGANVRLGKNVLIYPQVYIGDNVTIGDNTILYAGVKIYADCNVGERCIIHSGAVIGADGFGFAKEGDSFKKIPQLGNVVIEDDVEIGANTTIDRAVMESTLIRKGVKLDNLIQIAHNVEIGENTGMAAQSGISGSTKVGKNCIFGGQVGLGGHIKIGDNVSIGAQSGIISNIKPDKNIMGSPAFDVKDFFRSSIIIQKLPEIYRTVNQLQKEVETLKKELNKE